MGKVKIPARLTMPRPNNPTRPGKPSPLPNQTTADDINKHGPTGRPYRVTLPFASSDYPYNTRDKHSGVDMSPRPGGFGEPLYACFDGIVKSAGWYGNYGLCVIVTHYLPFDVWAKDRNGMVHTIEAGKEFEFFYGHCKYTSVQPQDIVRAGRKLGAIGNTGLSYGPHVHLECRYNRAIVNPMDILIACKVLTESQIVKAY